MVVYSPPLPFPEIKSEAFKSQLPQSFDSTQPVKIEDDTLTGFPFGENYENTAVPGPIRPKRLAVERFNESFTTVLGKLALLNAKEHKMTVGELHRRVNGPEALHSSLLLGLMRTGKGKVKGELLRAKLMDYGIVLHHGQRKTKNSTMFTSLCESEARNLAVDFTGLCLMEGSAEEIGKAYLEEQLSRGMDFRTIMFEIHAIHKFMGFITRLHSPELLPGELDSTTNAEKGVENLSLFTHGFSHVAISGVAKYLEKMVLGMKIRF